MTKIIKLGQRVRDISCGYEGIVVTKCEYISGVTDYGVRADAKDGTRPTVEYIEEALLEIINDGIKVKPIVKTMGFYKNGNNRNKTS